MQVVKDSLQTKGNAFKIIGICRHVIDSSSECSDDEESLKQTIHVTSGSFVDKALELILSCFVSSSPFGRNL